MSGQRSTEFDRNFRRWTSLVTLDILGCMSPSQFDVYLFTQLNSVFTHPIIDKLMPIITDLHKQPIFLGVVGLFLIYCMKRAFLKTMLVVLGMILSFTVTDTFSHHVVKAHFERPRPEAAGLSPVLRTHSHSGFSFPSNHTANCFGIASFLGFVFPGFRGLLLGIALLIGYSRVYVGVHFPSDILGGAIIGILASILVFKIIGVLDDRLQVMRRGSEFSDIEKSRRRVRKVLK